MRTEKINEWLISDSQINKQLIEMGKIGSEIGKAARLYSDALRSALADNGFLSAGLSRSLADTPYHLHLKPARLKHKMKRKPRRKQMKRRW